MDYDIYSKPYQMIDAKRDDGESEQEVGEGETGYDPVGQRSQMAEANN